MSKYQISEQARIDLDDIYEYIARENPMAANKVEDEILEIFDKLADNPYMGAARENLTSQDVRFWNIHSYMIIYQPDAKPLEIIRILSGYRDIPVVL